MLGRHPGHSSETGWSEIQLTIDDLETECMDPEVEDHYKELLSQWKKDEGNVKDKLDDSKRET